MSCFAVIDVETTGLNPYRHDRVLEIALLLIRPTGEVLREFVSLINPERDVGPVSLHGLTSGDVLHAPRFIDAARTLLDVLQGCVALVGHNVRFDTSFLSCEFERIGHQLPKYPTLCTMQLAGGGNLSSCCLDYQVKFVGDAHSALHDARATAGLLVKLLADSPRTLSEYSNLPPIVWPILPRTPVNPLTRDESRRRQAEPPTYLQKLLARVESSFAPDTDDSAVLAYTSLLDRVLEDRRADKEEGQSLLEVATRWGLSANRISEIHRDYLQRLAIAALVDGVVTDSERRDMSLVAQLLGVDHLALKGILQTAKQNLSGKGKSSPPVTISIGATDLSGKRVCFTGECQCRLKGEAITRELATELATQRGLVVVESVTKKLDLLVVADPLTQSGKAKKARKYGIRVMHEAVFWKVVKLAIE